MTRRSIDVDDHLLDRARVVLGTDTIEDTVNAALAAAVERRRAQVHRALDYFAELSREGGLGDRTEAR